MLPSSWYNVDVAYDIGSDGRTMLFGHWPSTHLPGGFYLRDTSVTAQPQLLQPLGPYDVHGEEWALSPDATRAAYTGDYLKIHVLEIATGEDLQITPEDQSASGPAWDPTGRYLLYLRHYDSYQAPDSLVGLTALDLATGEARLITHNGAPVRGNWAEWSPDGQWVVFSYGVYIGPPSLSTPMHVIVVSVDGTAYTDLTPRDPRSNEHPHWSVDGRQIIFESFDYGDRHIHDTRVVNSDGTGYRAWPVDLKLNQSTLSPDWGYFLYSEPDSSQKWGVLYAQDTKDVCAVARRQVTYVVYETSPPRTEAMDRSGASRVRLGLTRSE